MDWKYCPARGLRIYTSLDVILEGIGTPKAKAVLEKLAREASRARERNRARAALARLATEEPHRGR